MAKEKLNDEAKSKGVIGNNKPLTLGRAMAKAPLSRLKPTTFSKDTPFQPVLRTEAIPASSAPGVNPFKDLPFPSPGERIKADDFKKLSQSLKIIYETYSLSSALFGQNFWEVKLALSSQQYEISRVMSVFGTEIEYLEDESLDNRKVIQIIPEELGAQQVNVILTEAVETRRFAPNLLGLSHKAASEKLGDVLGDITVSSKPVYVPDLEGLKLTEAQEAMFASI